MPLSEYEQRVLEQMERQLSTDDPKLANTFQAPATHSGGRYLLAGVGVVVGLLMLIVGVAKSVPLVGVFGFAIMFAAVVFAFSKPRNKPDAGPIGLVGPDGGVRPMKPKSPNGQSDFMRRFEERWDKRQDDGL